MHPVVVHRDLSARPDWPPSELPGHLRFGVKGVRHVSERLLPPVLPLVPVPRNLR